MNDAETEGRDWSYYRFYAIWLLFGLVALSLPFFIYAVPYRSKAAMNLGTCCGSVGILILIFGGLLWYIILVSQL